MKKAISESAIGALSPPPIFERLSGEICVKGPKQVALNVHLKIKHGSILLLNNVVWKIRDEDITSAN